MGTFHYPIKVIRKKFTSPSYKPVAIDCNTGETLKLNSSRKDYIKTFGIQLLLLIVPLLLLHFIVLDPVIQTTISRSAVEDSLVSLSKEDSAVIRTLKDGGVLVSENIDSGLVTLIIEMEKPEMQKSLELAFSLTTLKEVSTDGKTISISFLSSDK